MKIRRQTKRFSCDTCGAVYLHDDAYHHAVFFCPLRPLTRTQILERFLTTGRTYCPTPVSGRG